MFLKKVSYAHQENLFYQKYSKDSTFMKYYNITITILQLQFSILSII